MVSTQILRTPGGAVVLPDAPLIDRADGGHLMVTPSRDVWERGELSLPELAQWSALVAATGWAMLTALPQLEDGCMNYWEAGNWALHEAAAPAGPKRPREHRRVHAHVLGRSRSATHPSWLWGEAPLFPRFGDAARWRASFQRLTSQECSTIASRIAERLATAYAMDRASVTIP